MHNHLNILKAETNNLLDKSKIFLNDRTGLIASLIEKDFSKDDLAFYPQLTFMAALGSEKIDETVRTIGILNLIMYISTEIHNNVPIEPVGEKTFFQEVQVPILAGDLLYSKLFNILCTHNLTAYIGDFIKYIEPFNTAWINYLENKLSDEEFCSKKFGELGRTAMLTGTKAVHLPEHWAGIMGEYGYALANIYGAKQMKLSQKFVDKQLKTLDGVLLNLGSQELKSLFTFKIETTYQQYRENDNYELLKLKAVAAN
ncbi:MAG: hypothetical protein GX923_04495 [Clostridia bacterium]|nr:hypothetical protein [Clostridia bacterium]